MCLLSYHILLRHFANKSRGQSCGVPSGFLFLCLFYQLKLLYEWNTPGISLIPHQIRSQNLKTWKSLRSFKCPCYFRRHRLCVQNLSHTSKSDSLVVMHIVICISAWSSAKALLSLSSQLFPMFLSSAFFRVVSEAASCENNNST